MESRTPRSESADLADVMALATVGTAGVMLLSRRTKAPLWSLAAVAAAAWFVHAQRSLRQPEPPVDRLDLSDWGVRHYRDDAVEAAVSWSDLEEVLVVTPNEGDDTPHLVLHGTTGASVVVPHLEAEESGALHELERRLVGYDTQSIFDAILHRGAAVFVVWRAERAAIHTPVKLDWTIRKPDDMSS